MHPKIEESKTAIRVVGGAPLDKPRGPWVRTTPIRKDSDGDNSVTQYAILGLNAASRADIKISPVIWRKTLQTTLDRQEKNGGGGYPPKKAPLYERRAPPAPSAGASAGHKMTGAEPTNDCEP